MRKGRATVFWLIILSPLILLTRRGRQLAPALPTAAVTAVSAGLVMAAVATVVFVLVFWDSFDALLYFLMYGVHVLMSLAEAFTAAFVLSRRGQGRFGARLVSGFFGAAVAYWLWSVLLGLLWPMPASGELTVVILFYLAPSAVIGGSGAALAAALVAPGDVTA